MERVRITLLGRKIQLYNRQYEVIHTTFFPYMYYAIKLMNLGKNIIFREEKNGSVFYYIFNEDNEQIIILRDDEREFENILKKIKGAIIKAIMQKFNLGKFGVTKYDDGFHVVVNDIPVGKKYKSEIIKPELLPPLPVHYTVEKDDEGKINKDYVVLWKDYLNAVYFSIKLNYTNDIVEKIKMLYESGKSINDIAKDLRMTYSQVRWVLVKNKVKLRRRSIPNEVKEKVITLAKQGIPSYKIARELNLNEGTVLRILRKEGLIKRKKKMSEKEIDIILQLHKEGESIYKIAKILDRSTSLVYKYVKQFKNGNEGENYNKNNLAKMES